MFPLGWACLVLFAVAAGKALSFSATLADTAALLAEQDGTGARPILYQNSITPPFLTNLTIALWVGMAGSVAWIWWQAGWPAGIVAVLTALVVPAVSQAIVPPRRNSPVYVRQAFHSLVNRSANYQRDGDHERAIAAKELADRLAVAYADILR